MNGRLTNKDEMDRIEYQQIREDIRHINKMMYYAFSVMVVVFAFLMNVSYQISINQDINQPQNLFFFIGIIGGMVISFVILIIISLDKVRKVGCKKAKEIYQNSLLNDINPIQDKLFLWSIIVLFISLLIWIGYLLLLWIELL